MANKMRNIVSGFAVSCGCAALLLGSDWAPAADPAEAPNPPVYVVEHWEEEFTALEKEIREKTASYDRNEAPYKNQRILDKHSCILPGDHTPFDVEYRRTHALLRWLEERCDVQSLENAQRRLSRLGETVRERVAASGPPTRPQAISDYFAVAALRRNVAMSNPLLDFDAVLFVGRGNYYGDDPTGQHQLSGPLAFCNRVGGGLYMVNHFQTDAKVVDVLEHSVVENGS